MDFGREVNARYRTAARVKATAQARMQKLTAELGLVSLLLVSPESIPQVRFGQSIHRRKFTVADTAPAAFKNAAKRIASEWERHAALRREGCIDPRQEALSGEGRKTIETHLADYKAKLEAGGSGERHVSRTHGMAPRSSA